jgi:hypothetical protein
MLEISLYNTTLDKNLKFKINDKLWNYLIKLSDSLHIRKFKGFFFKTMNLYQDFKHKKIIHNNLPDFYRRCQYLAILQIMAMFHNISSYHFIKIGPSILNKKSVCIIDDSTVIDTESFEIRISNGSINEPLRGFCLFNSLSPSEKDKIINLYFYLSKSLKFILLRLNYASYDPFDPILILQKIIHYSNHNRLYPLIDHLASEFFDLSHIFSYDHKIKLFEDYDKLLSLWNSNFITDNQGKLRIIILCILFIYKDNPI